MLDRNIEIDLITSGCGGILDELHGKGLRRFNYRYRFSTNKTITFIRYFKIQIYTFLLALRYSTKKDAVFYINTLLPIGPALAGRLMNKRVIYHYHENAFAKGVFYKILCCGMELLANVVICVSDYQRSFLHRKENVIVIPNAIPRTFIERLCPAPHVAFKRQKIMMLSSLKLYKGTLEFITLAKQMPEYGFTLIINDTQDAISKFKTDHDLTWSENLEIHARQSDVAPFYNSSSMVLNLSNKKIVVETFGLTALEAMSAGLPIIVPTEGGIADMVDNGVNGYKIDVQQLDKITTTIKEILTDQELYCKLSTGALNTAQHYSEHAMIEAIIAKLNK